MPRTGSSERRFVEIGRAVTDSRFLAIVVWDAEGKIVDVDPTLAELLGYAPAELSRRPWTELTPDRYRPLDRRAADGLQEHGRFAPYEKHLLRADGSEVPVLVGGAALGGAQANAGGIAFVLDLTERQAVQEALQLSEQQFHALARHLPGVVYLCDQDRWQPFRFVNEGIEQLTGIAARRFCDGRATFRDLVHADDVGRVAQEIQASLARRRPFHVVYRLRHSGGDWRWVEEHGQAVRGEGELRFIEGVILDVTARHQAEEAAQAAHDQLRAARDELEERVHQRTAKLRQANQRLRRERAFLRRTLDQQEQQRQLVAYEIHDGLAQYITGALMQLEAFMGMRKAELGTADGARSPASPRSRASETAMPSGFHNLEVGLDLLRKSLDEARRLISGLRPPILDEKGLVAAIEYLISEQPPLPQGIHFTHDVQFERLPPLWESNLFRIVQEALNNVTRHGRARTARVDLWQKGQTLHVAVVDDGQGFDRKKLPVDPLPAARKHGQQGIRKRARLLGGKATIRSAPGQGTRINVTLPLPTH